MYVWLLLAFCFLFLALLQVLQTFATFEGYRNAEVQVFFVALSDLSDGPENCYTGTAQCSSQEIQLRRAVCCCLRDLLMRVAVGVLSKSLSRTTEVYEAQWPCSSRIVSGNSEASPL